MSSLSAEGIGAKGYQNILTTLSVKYSTIIEWPLLALENVEIWLQIQMRTDTLLNSNHLNNMNNASIDRSSKPV